VTSHNGRKIKAIALDDSNQIPEHVTERCEVIGIDEVQFFSENIINIICQLVNSGKRVIVAGLDLDFKRVPFGCMPTLMAIADSVTKLKAICMQCGTDAHFTQRLVDGKPAQSSDPIVLVGAEESYQATCRECHVIDTEPTF
jgi:thymidine kinase